MLGDTIVKPEYLLAPRAMKTLFPAAHKAFPAFLNQNEGLDRFWNIRNIRGSFVFALDGSKVYAVGRADLGDGFVKQTCNGYLYENGKWRDLKRKMPHHLFDIQKARQIIDRVRVLVAKYKDRVGIDGFDFGLGHFEPLPAEIMDRASKIMGRDVSDVLGGPMYPSAWPTT